MPRAYVKSTAGEKQNLPSSKGGGRKKRPKYEPLKRAALEAEFREVLAQAESVESLSGIVLLVMQMLRTLGLRVVRYVVETRSHRRHTTRRGAPHCSTCGQRMCKPKRARTTRLTLLGRLRYWRWVWNCKRCKRGESPSDAALQLVALHHGHSLEFVEKLALFCVLHSFGRACDLFERCFGVSVSTHLAYPLVMGIGKRLHDEQMREAKNLWEQRAETPERFEPTPAELRRRQRAGRVYVMLDNSKLRIQEGKRGRGAPKRKKTKGVEELFNLAVGRQVVPVLEDDSTSPKKKKSGKRASNEDWRDVRAILVYRDGDRAQTSKGRGELLRRRVLAHIGTQDELRMLLHMVLHQECVYTAREVVVVADGGAGIWEMIDELLPSTLSRPVVQILDWCHAVSHLWKVAKLYKQGKRRSVATARASRVGGLVKHLARGRVSNVLQRLQRLQPKAQGDLADELRRCIDYFETHRSRMHTAASARPA